MNNRYRFIAISLIFAVFIVLTPPETFWKAETYGAAKKLYLTVKTTFIRLHAPTAWTWDEKDIYSYGIDGGTLRMPWAEALIPPMSDQSGSYTLTIKAAPVEGVTLKGHLCGQSFDLPVERFMPKNCFIFARHLRIEALGRPAIEGNRLNYAHPITIELAAAP